MGPSGLEVEYPEGPKVPEGDLQMWCRGQVAFALHHWAAARADAASTLVVSDINVYYREGNPRAVVAPGAAVAFGVDPTPVVGRSVYKVWEVGAPPGFVLEIMSPFTAKSDQDRKPAKFAELGVREYWRCDPTGGDLMSPHLQGDRRVGSAWEPIAVHGDGAGGLVGHSSVLGLDLRSEPPKLRFFDLAADRWLLDPDDLLEAHAAAEAQAAAAEARIAAAEAQAAASEAELAALRRQTDQREPPG